MSVWLQANVVEGMWGHRRVMTAAPAAALSCSDFTSRTLSAGSAWATLQRKAWRRRLSHHIPVSDQKNIHPGPVSSLQYINKSFKISQCLHHFPAICLLLLSCGNLGLVSGDLCWDRFKSPVTTRSLPIPQSFATASAAARWSPVHIHTSKSSSALTMPAVSEKTYEALKGTGILNTCSGSTRVCFLEMSRTLSILV